MSVCVSVQRAIKDVSSGFSCEKGNDGAGCSEPLLWRCRRGDANVKSKCCSGVCMGMQWASDCSTTTDPLLSQRFPTDTLRLVPIHALCNVCVSVKERERRRLGVYVCVSL